MILFIFMTTSKHCTVVCPACSQPMANVRTVWRAFHDDLYVFECRPCGVTVSQTLSDIPALRPPREIGRPDEGPDRRH